MPISPIFDSTHHKDFEVNHSQIQPNGFLKITELFNMFQLTAAEHAEFGGISFVDLQTHNQAWVLSKMRVEIKNLPKMRDKISVKTWIVNLENSRSLRGMFVFCNKEIIASTETLWVILNTQKRRPETLALAHDHFEKYPENFANSKRVESIVFENEMNCILNKKVVFSDLDLVNHVNHIKYLEWCLDILHTDILLKNKIKSLDLNYLSELVLNDEFDIKSNVNGELHQFLISKNSTNCFGLQISCSE
jgi:acyl-ACP thioesterase